MNILFFLLGLLLFGAVIAHNMIIRNKPFYPYSKTGEPFEEYDEDGFLTHESYQSHIKHYPNGGSEVDIGAMVKTRKWKENMDACQKLREHLEANKH